jgi:hypothetical protein
MFAITSGGNGRSLENGLPGAKRMRKKDTVIKTNIVGIASNILFAMNLSINSLFQSVTVKKLMIDNTRNLKDARVPYSYSFEAKRLVSFDVKIF